MTYSIIARDPTTGELGAAVQSHFFNIAVHAFSAEPGVGIVAIQMMPQPAYRARGLDAMRAGASAAEALQAARAADPGAAMRQVAMLDARGCAAAFTGDQCVSYSAHCVDDGLSAQAVMCKSADIAPAMIGAFRQSSGPLAERMLAALDEAQALGGDLRGQKSAALVVVSGQASPEPWRDWQIDLRVEDHPRPLVELRRLLELHRFHGRANRALDLAMAGCASEALSEYASLESENAADPDIALRHAFVLALTGDAPRARARLDTCYQLHDGWREVVTNMISAGMLGTDSNMHATLLAR
jgi:uncharacterized Ntn-hydrolase superfamily protein